MMESVDRKKPPQLKFRTWRRLKCEWVIREPTKFIGFTYQDIADLFLCDFNLLFHKEINENLPLLEGYIKTWHLHMLILQKSDF